MAMVFISKRFNRQFKPPKFQFFFTYCGQGYGYGKKDFALRPNKLKKGNRLSCKKNVVWTGIKRKERKKSILL